MHLLKVTKLASQSQDPNQDICLQSSHLNTPLYCLLEFTDTQTLTQLKKDLCNH